MMLLTLSLALALTTADAPDELLREAEAQAADGRYAAALRLYEELAAEHANTKAGRTAARRTEPNALLGWTPLITTGPPENRMDVVIAGDGYVLGHLDTFENQAAEVPKVFERDRALGEYLPYLNFTRAAVVSEEDGVDGYDRSFSTAFDCFNSGKIEGDVDLDRERAQIVLRDVPVFEGFAVVISRAGQRGTGRAGFAVAGERDPINLLRAVGGAFGLGDELETDQGVAIEIFDAPNISRSGEPDKVPWKHWLDARNSGVGIYPGGLGRVDGVFKPVASSCAMEDSGIFCPVCREAIVIAIHRFVDPIESVTPAAGELETERRMTFEVKVMQPETHALDVSWWVLPEAEVPAAPAPRKFDDRRARGPLPPIAAEPRDSSRADRKGLAKFKLDTNRLDPGRYRVVCRVVDPAKPKGEKLPWVLADPDGLLQSERGWWIVVE